MAKRNVFFYEIRPTRRKDLEWRLDVSGLIEALDALPTDQRIREVRGNTGDFYEFVQVIHKDHRGTNPAIAYVRCRDHGLPMLERDAILEPLTIAAGRRLAELTHAVFFDRHVIGAEYNHYGPRLSSLASYLADKVPQCLPANNRVSIVPLINTDLLALLRDAPTIRSLSLKMAPLLVDSIQKARHLPSRDALSQLFSGYGAQRLGIDIQNRKGLAKDEVIGLVDWAFEQGAGLLSAAHAVVQLEDGTHQPINLLRSRIGAEREMELIDRNARSIAHQSARVEIMEAFEALEDQINVAISLASMGPNEDGS